MKYLLPLLFVVISSWSGGTFAQETPPADTPFTWNLADTTGSFLVGDRIKIECPAGEDTVILKLKLFRATILDDTIFSNDPFLVLSNTEQREIRPSQKTIEYIGKGGNKGTLIVVDFQSGQKKISTENLEIREPRSIIADALELKDKIKSSDFVTAKLLPYGITYKNIHENPFLASVLKLDSVLIVSNNGSGPGEQNALDPDQKGAGNSALNVLGGMDVTSLADGLAKFLVKRTKEELNITFFQNFKDAIAENEDFGILFPATSDGLSLIGEEIYNYQRYLEMLREQFYEDLTQLPIHVQQLPELQKKEYEVVRLGLQTGTQLLQDIRAEKHPGNIIENLITNGYEDLHPDLGGSLNAIKLLSKSLRAPTDEEGTYWAEDSMLREVFVNDTSLRIFLGLLAHVGEKVKFKTGTLKSHLISIEKKYTEVRPIVYDFTVLVNEIEELVQLQDSALTGRELSAYVSHLTSLYGLSQDLGEVLGIPSIVDKDSAVFQFLNTTSTAISQSLKLYANIKDKRYHAAVANLGLIYKTIHPTGKAPEKLLEYATFMASMLDAEDSDQVAAVIESFALPSGSWRIKRKSKFNVALNGYVGLYSGWQYNASSLLDSINANRPNSFGVTSPVGVSVSWGWEKFGSLGLFASLIDIGAITQYRFGNADSQIAKIYLREIFAPGIFVSYGCPKAPISLNLGLQQAAILSEVGTTENTYISSNLRFSAAIVVDIPILNLHTSSKTFAKK